jgi:DNA repair exonuclease SbcCD nuclease subunit
VFIVPGNHERSRLPHARFAAHPGVHIFDTARTFVARVRGATIGLSGFPYERRDIRTRFPELLEETKWREQRPDLRLLCIHHCVEGATVGPGDFTFTTAADVIRPRDVPAAFSAVLTGHIHRHQVLTTDMQRRSLDTPVLYPGSIERTSFAEVDEPKGFMVVRCGVDQRARDVRWEFRRLPARPMIRTELNANGLDARALASAIQTIIAAAPHDAVLSIRVDGSLTDAHWRVLSASSVRSLIPETMNAEIRPADGFDRLEQSMARSDAGVSTAQLNLYCV